jgi:pimeloyl-ACP methyl ester carboxylesterase
LLPGYPSSTRAYVRLIDRLARNWHTVAIGYPGFGNSPQYPAWQAWLRQRQPRLLAIWGANDPFFIPAGARAYKTDVPDAEVVLLDTGHFALEEEADTIAEHSERLLRGTFTD